MDVWHSHDRTGASSICRSACRSSFPSLLDGPYGSQACEIAQVLLEYFYHALALLKCLA